MNFYSKVADNLQVIMRPLHDFFHDNVHFYWNNELEALFQKTKTIITKDVTPTKSNTQPPFSPFF